MTVGIQSALVSGIGLLFMIGLMLGSCVFIAMRIIRHPILSYWYFRQRKTFEGRSK